MNTVFIVAIAALALAIHIMVTLAMNQALEDKGYGRGRVRGIGPEGAGREPVAWAGARAAFLLDMAATWGRDGRVCKNFAKGRFLPLQPAKKMVE